LRDDLAGIWDLDVLEVAEQVLDECPDSIPFDDFAQYHIVRPIGSGGMGDVFLAEDNAANRLVAIKFLRTCWFETDRRERFMREIQTLGMLEHPFIARLYETGIHASGTPYFVMEYVEGKPLNVFCDEHSKTFEERLALFRSVCEAVQFAHSRAVIHLDLKYSNIFIKEEGTPKLLDFGIAKQLAALNQPAAQTQALFTPAFAAPEQVGRTAVGTYTDVYALGVVLYELLAGAAPFSLDSEKRAPQRPSASMNRLDASKAAWRDLDMLCLRALENDPRDRYPSVTELIQDLDHFRRNEPLSARPHTVRYRASKFLQRNRRIVLLSTAAGIFLAALISFYTVRLTQARDAALLQADRTKRIQDYMVGMFGGDEYDAAPPADLRVVDMLDKATKHAQSLKQDPAVQADLFEALGGIYHNLGNLDQAATLLQSSLALRQNAAGPDQPETAESLIALAMLRNDQARFQESEKLARRAMAIAQQNLPATQKLLGEAMMALGAGMEQRGDYSEAIKVLDPAVKMLSQRSDENKDLIDSLTYLANSQGLLGHLAVAEPLYIRILAEDRKLYGDHHPSVAEDLSNLADIEVRRGLYAQAEQNMRQAVDIARAWYRKDNLEVSLLEAVLARVLISRNQYGEAALRLENSLRILHRDAGPNHPYVAFCWNWLGVIALKQHKVVEAQADFTHMDAIYRKLFSDDRHHIMGLQRFAELDVARGNTAAAEQSFRKLIQIDSKSFGKDNALTGAARIELGHTLLLEHQYAEAELQLRQGYAIVTQEGDTGMEPAVNARQDLASLRLK
jgi:tetratricopeptide (TPR) repeat protein/tRNA A-37 threonylcarbamoyl transferase component Bud32